MRNPRKYTQTLDKHPYANPSNKPAHKSQASGLTYAKSGGRNLGKSGTPNTKPHYCPQCAPLIA